LAGLGAIIILIPRAVTSHKKWKKRLGRVWKNLHRLVYLAAGLAVLHLAWVVKGDITRLSGDVWKPLAAGFTLALVLIARVPFIRKKLAALRDRLKSRRVFVKETSIT
jgi:sulfoxide reductase heme-binding subunit YedZ